jgi:hypothetical protein
LKYNRLWFNFFCLCNVTHCLFYKKLVTLSFWLHVFIMFLVFIVLLQVFVMFLVLVVLLQMFTIFVNFLSYYHCCSLYCCYIMLLVFIVLFSPFLQLVLLLALHYHVGWSFVGNKRLLVACDFSKNFCILGMFDFFLKLCDFLKFSFDLFILKTMC